MLDTGLAEDDEIEGTRAASLLSLVASTLVVTLAGCSTLAKHGTTVKLTGSEQTVFDWSAAACEDLDYPDLPVRAFRDSQGRSVLMGSTFVNRRMIGPDLGRLRHPCNVVLMSDLNPDPAAFADREWIASTYTTDGRTVWALLHNEYHGDVHSRCSHSPPVACIYNSVTLAVSRNGGRTFSHVSVPPAHLVASLPYKYYRGKTSHGLFTPTNIIRHDGFYYVMVRLKLSETERGMCVLRTKEISNPRSWRAWDGDGFNYKFIDPYLDELPPGQNPLCERVSQQAINDMTSSLTYNTYLKRFMLVGLAGAYSVDKKRTIWGIYYSVSNDLIHWSHRKLIKEEEIPSTYECGDRGPILYPTIIDPESRSRNFETVGQHAHLYYTREHYHNCQLTSDRDLVRVRITFSKG
jgi:hypothetical protein